jgi:drug/metabolite transporter (DMT)-like permease
LWATSFLAVKYVVQTIPPFTAAAFRFVIVIIILWALLFVLKVRSPRWPGLKDMPLIAATGLCQTTFYFAFQYWGLRWTTASNGAVLGNTRPIFVTLIAILFLHEIVTWRKTSGIIVAFIGVLLIIGFDSLYHLGSSTEEFVGDMALVLSAASGAVGLVLTKRVIGRFGPFPSLAYTNSFGALGLVVLAIAEIQSLGTFPKTTLTPWLALVYQAVFTTIVAHVLWNTVLSRKDASWAAVFLYITPVMTALLSWAFLSEQPTWNLVAGAALVFWGTYLVTRQNSRTKAVESS